MSAPILAVRDLAAGYGRRTIVQNVSLEVRRNEILAVIGPNGSGKSTLLKAVSGLLPVQAGSVELEGLDVTDASVIERARRGTSLVLQGARVFGELSVEENLELGGYSLGGKARLAERKKSIFATFPLLEERRRRRALTLSGGERQALALAMGLMPGPRLLLLDEPTAGLAESLAEQFLTKVERLVRTLEIGVVIVEQRVQQAFAVANRVCVLRLGRVGFLGAVADLQPMSRLKEVYFGEEAGG